MMRTKTYFASDLHLGSDIYEDPRVAEKRFVQWLDLIKEDARALYLLGDVFDFWFEYKKVVPRGFVRFLGKIAELSDLGVEVHFFTGNHDIWIFDYLPHETGVRIHKEPLTVDIDGQTFYLAHGDGLGDDSRSFRFLRAVFHNPLCQRLFALIPSRWGIAFAHRWSRHNRKKDIAFSQPYMGENREHLVLFAKDYLKTHPEINYFIFGHRHIMLDLQLAPTTRLLILGDWMQHFSYAVLENQALTLQTLDT